MHDLTAAMTVPAYLAFAVPAAFIAGMFLGLWVKRDDYDDGRDDGYVDGYGEARDDVKQAGLDPDELQVSSKPALEPDGSGLDPELPDWTDAQLRALRDDDGPGETTGPFTITDLDGLDPRIAVCLDLPGPEFPLRGATLRDMEPSLRAGEPYRQFTDLPMATAAELEQEWSWGLVAYQIVELRKFLDSDAWDIKVAA
jgi:hypothetical protein